MLDERARALLDYTHPNDVTLMLVDAAHPGVGRP
jgi:cell division protein FtsB